ncbi:hypothetical protein [Microcoleus sp. herbarium12]|uniref:hypothetical protein n=1 Tax=Microcoleus sp. herbarium12 TaxID=3055437 RepID=UPI002FD409EC
MTAAIELTLATQTALAIVNINYVTQPLQIAMLSPAFVRFLAKIFLFGGCLLSTLLIVIFKMVFQIYLLGQT